MDLSQSLILQCALMATKKARWNDALRIVHDYAEMQVYTVCNLLCFSVGSYFIV